MTFGEKVKTIREKKGLSQSALAERMDISQQAVAKYEKIVEQPKLPTVRKIAEALKVSISELVDDWTRFTPEEISSDIDKDTVYESSHRLIEALESIEKEDGELDQDLLKKELPNLIKITRESSALNKAFEDAQIVRYSKKMTELLKMLNDDGKDEAVKRVKELTQLIRYQNLAYNLEESSKDSE